MIKFFLKITTIAFIALFSLSSLSIADNHASKKEIISELRKDITELGEKPIKRKFLQGDKKYIANLKDQKEELEKEILASGFLQNTYHYNPSLIDVPPHFTPEDEAYSRSGHFYEN